MKKFVLFLSFICVVSLAFTQNDSFVNSKNSQTVWTTRVSICIGDTYFISLLEDFDSVNYCVYSHNGIYDTSYTTGMILKPDTNPDNTVLYTLESVNGEVPTDTYLYYVSSKVPHAITIPQD